MVETNQLRELLALLREYGVMRFEDNQLKIELAGSLKSFDLLADHAAISSASPRGEVRQLSQQQQKAASLLDRLGPEYRAAFGLVDDHGE